MIKRTTIEERAHIANYAIIHHHNFKLTAETFNVTYQQVYRWVKKIEHGGVKALADRRGRRKEWDQMNEVERLHYEVKHLKFKRENAAIKAAFLSQLTALGQPQSTQQAHRYLQYQILQQLHAEQHFPISRMTSLLGISRQAYYQWQQHKVSKNKLFNQLVTTKLLEIYENYCHAIGSYQMTIELNACPDITQRVNRKRVIRIMHEQHISCRIRTKSQTTQNSQILIRPNNLLDRHFNVTRPNLVWVADTTPLTFGDTVRHTIRLSAVMDLYGRRILAYSTSSTETPLTVIQTFNKALLAVGNVHPLVHTDCGPAYASPVFQEYVTRHQLTHSMSRPGTPYDNSVMERWWNNFKLVWINGHPEPTTRNELEDLIAKGVSFFNTRVHSKDLNGLSPDEYWHQALVLN